MNWARLADVSGKDIVAADVGSVGGNIVASSVVNDGSGDAVPDDVGALRLPVAIMSPVDHSSSSSSLDVASPSSCMLAGSVEMSNPLLPGPSLAGLRGLASSDLRDILGLLPGVTSGETFLDEPAEVPLRATGGCCDWARGDIDVSDRDPRVASCDDDREWRRIIGTPGLLACSEPVESERRMTRRASADWRR